MERTKPTEKPRAFEMTLDIEASREDVWRALTEAEELMRWFPLEARITPGQGGSMFWSWGERWDWENRIEVWEPGRRLRLVEDEARPYDAEGHPLPDGLVQPARIAIEFTLETHRGKTRLRLVHSGFGRGDVWDNELDSISEGWQSELRSLRHYLQHHGGKNRQVGRAWI
ncbi:MAG: SRPBCC domain-containing protein, partial [Gemmatimonadetes bacterium]|nr:SRPBCC domain-containing protein [Gemmatimonadota bacterium]